MRAQKQGAKVAGLPIEPPIKLEFIINLKTAKTPVERRRIVVMSAFGGKADNIFLRAE